MPANTDTPQAPARPAAGVVTPEMLARRFHETYERLAPTFGYATRPESAKPWDEVPEQNRALMVAVCSEVLRALAAPAPAPVGRTCAYCERPMREDERSGTEDEDTHVACADADSTPSAPAPAADGAAVPQSGEVEKALDYLIEETRNCAPYEGYPRWDRRLAKARQHALETIAAAQARAADGWERECNMLRAIGNENAAIAADLRARLAEAEGRAAAAVEAINTACGIIEKGDQRLLAIDGPAGGQPPDLSLDEWRQLYETLDAARAGSPRSDDDK